MSSDDNHRQAHLTPMARNICTLLPPLLLILVFTPILVHTIVTEGHYILCSMKEFLKNKKKMS